MKDVYDLLSEMHQLGLGIKIWNSVAYLQVEIGEDRRNRFMFNPKVDSKEKVIETFENILRGFKK